jgi:hypothetical protein
MWMRDPYMAEQGLRFKRPVGVALISFFPSGTLCGAH